MNVIYKEPNWKSYIVETTNPVFTPEQCNIISKIGRSMPPINAEVGAGRYDTKQRLSHISWIPFNNVDAKPMYETLNQLMYITNKIWKQLQQQKELWKIQNLLMKKKKRF